MNHLRWLLTYFTGIATLPLPILLAMVLDTVIGSRLCPRGQMISDMCLAPWFRWVEFAIACAGVGLGAALVVALPAMIAPSEKSTVAGFMFWTGATLAMVLGLMGGVGLFVPSAVAMLTGWWVRQRWPERAMA